MAFVPPSCTPASLVGRAVARPSLCLPRRHSRRFRHQPCTVAALLPKYWVRSCEGGAWAEHTIRFRTHVWTELSCWQMRTFTETPQFAVGVPAQLPPSVPYCVFRAHGLFREWNDRPWTCNDRLGCADGSSVRAVATWQSSPERANVVHLARDPIHPCRGGS